MRREHDFYETPPWMTRVLLEHVEIDGPILEPCVGDGAISQVLGRSTSRILTNDIAARESDYHVDATTADAWDVFDHAARRCLHGPIAWVVTNPPWNLAHKILPLAFERASVGVAMLLRLSFVEPLRSEKSAGRAWWMVEHPPSDVIVLPRWSFTGDGKVDSVCPAWMVWYKQPRPQRLIITPPSAIETYSAPAHIAARPEARDVPPLSL